MNSAKLNMSLNIPTFMGRELKSKGNSFLSYLKLKEKNKLSYRKIVIFICSWHSVVKDNSDIWLVAFHFVNLLRIKNYRAEESVCIGFSLTPKRRKIK